MHTVEHFFYNQKLSWRPNIHALGGAHSNPLVLSCVHPIYSQRVVFGVVYKRLYQKGADKTFFVYLDESLHFLLDLAMACPSDEVSNAEEIVHIPDVVGVFI